MQQNRPGVIFAMRYPNDIGYVHLTLAKCRDLIARELGSRADCVITFPQLAEKPAYEPRWLTTAAANFYDDFSEANKKLLSDVLRRHNTRLIVLQGAEHGAVDLKFFRSHGVRIANTENESYDQSMRNGMVLGTAKFVAREVLQHGLYDLYVANAKSQWEFLRRFAHIPASRLSLIYDGVDTTRYHPGERQAACSETGLDPQKIWIMSAAQARPVKRIDFIIEAARRLVAANPGRDFGFFHVGDGECLADWREAAASKGLENRFRFVGHQADLAPFYRSASIFVHASLRESFGLAIVEAMSSGLPVVGTRSAGPEEIIVDGQTGRLIAPDDMDEFVRAIQAYLDDRSLREMHGENGRSRANERFSLERQAAEFARVLETRFLK